MDLSISSFRRSITGLFHGKRARLQPRISPVCCRVCCHLREEEILAIWKSSFRVSILNLLSVFQGTFFAVYWEYVYAQKAFQALNWFRLKLLAPQKKTKAKTVFPVEKGPMKREHENQCKNMLTLNIMFHLFRGANSLLDIPRLQAAWSLAPARDEAPNAFCCV